MTNRNRIISAVMKANGLRIKLDIRHSADLYCHLYRGNTWIESGPKGFLLERALSFIREERGL